MLSDARPSIADLQRHASAVRRAVLDAADPRGAVRTALEREPLDADGLRLIAIGKGSVAMAIGAAAALGPRLDAGLVVCPPEHADRIDDPRLRALPADHPYPTERNLAAGAEIERFAIDSAGTPGVLCLVSGGGSAQLTAPLEGLSLEDLERLTRDLLASGAEIGDVNAVRKHLDRLKGGRLGLLLAPAPVRVLVVSDVLGNDLSAVSSGPVSPDPTTFSGALAVLERFGLAGRHDAVRRVLERGRDGGLEETPKPGDGRLGHVTARVIADNSIAVRAAGEALRGLGFEAVETETQVTGEAREVGQRLADRARGLLEAPGAGAVVLGGEATVTLGDDPGKGGRNQEVAVAAALALAGDARAAVLTIATDGVDGPTDAAGAVLSAARAAEARAELADALARHDVYPALDRLGALVRTGPSGTNVNDVAAVLVYPL